MRRALSTGRKDRCPKAKVKGAVGLTGGGAGRACAGGDWQDGGFGLAGNVQGGMEEFGERFDAGGEARARARKVATGLKRIDAAVSNSRNGVPRFREGHGLVLVASLLGAVATRSDQ